MDEILHGNHISYAGFQLAINISTQSKCSFCPVSAMSSHLGLIRNRFNFLNRNVLCTKTFARGEQALATSVFIELIIDQA